MSLLNDVLRDLQARGAGEADPLAGLQPVTARRSPDRRLVPLLWLATAVTLAVLWPLLRPEGHAVSAVRLPQTTLAPAPAVPDLPPLSPIDIESLPPLRAVVAVPPSRPAPVAAVEEPPAVATVTVVEDVAASDTVETAAPTPIITRRVAAETGTATTTTTTISRGLAALRARNVLAAAGFFEGALRIDPGHSEAWQYLYAARSAAGQVETAEQVLQRGLVAARSPAPLAKLYARRLLERGDTTAAIGLLQRYRPAPASDTEYDTLFAGLLLRNRQFAAAGEIYRQLLDHDASPGAWWIGLAMSSDSLGDTPAALAAFERALRADGLEPPLADYAERRIVELRTHG